MILYAKQNRDKGTPMIRSYGNACERTKRQITQVVAGGVFAAAVLLLVLQSSVLSSVVDDMKETPLVGQRHVQRRPLHGKLLAEQDGAPHVLVPPVTAAVALPTPGNAQIGELQFADDVDGIGAAAEGSGSAACETDRREMILAITASEQAATGVAATFPAADHTRQHLDMIMALLGDPNKQRCFQRQRLAVASKRATDMQRFFFDLGSRSMDQTIGFVQRYPSAKDFALICFEANPRFNRVYEQFKQQNPNVQLKHFNEAVGVADGVLLLSDQSVGSSVVREAGAAHRSKAPGDVEVKVVDFAQRFSDLVASAAMDTGSYVIIKMDIEKMEFAVLHRMLRTGAFLLVDELLLECHYNTNLPKERRDPLKHIGLDDCVALVQALNAAMSAASGPRTFEAVLWNSVKTAKGSGYTQRHGGFRPS